MSRFPSPLSPVRPPRFLNRASWRLASLVEAPYRRMVRAWRAEALGLTGPTPNLTDRVARDGVLHAWSPHLLPAPDDWSAELAPTGFWSGPPDDGWAPPEALVRFLDAGEPPVYVGFGSALARNPEVFTRTVLDGLHRSGRRAVLATGWGALRPSSVPEAVHVLDQVPHGWLLPRTAGAVHHGGVGTVAAALRAGVPQVIRPFLGDQPFWARRVHEIGVAAPPPTGRLTADRLATAIDDAASRASVAHETGARVREEDGVSAAVARIERRTAGA